MNTFIKGKVILQDGTLIEYSAVQMFTDGSYVLNVGGDHDLFVKYEVSHHVEDLHNICINCISNTK